MQIPPLQGEVLSALQSPRSYPHPESRPMPCRTLHIRGMPSTVHNCLCDHRRHKNQRANFINPKLSMTRLTLEESRRSQQSPNEPRKAQGSPDEAKRAQESPDEPRRAQTSPEEHRRAQESPEEPETWRAQKSRDDTRRAMERARMYAACA